MSSSSANDSCDILAIQVRGLHFYQGVCSTKDVTPSDKSASICDVSNEVVEGAGDDSNEAGVAAEAPLPKDCVCSRKPYAPIRSPESFTP